MAIKKKLNSNGDGGMNDINESRVLPRIHHLLNDSFQTHHITESDTGDRVGLTHRLVLLPSGVVL